MTDENVELYEGIEMTVGSCLDTTKDHQPSTSRKSHMERKEISPKAILVLSGLTWWTSDADIEALSQALKIGEPIRVAFQEHKNNGKSKGIATVEYPNRESALAVKKFLETNGIHGNFPSIVYSDILKKIQPQSHSHKKKKHALTNPKHK